MKKVAILCQTAPGGKRRLAEEALRLATGLTATGRLQIDLILTQGGTALLHPEMGPCSLPSIRSPTRPSPSLALFHVTLVAPLPREPH